MKLDYIMSHCEITDQYLEKLYDDCLREEARLLNGLRISNPDETSDDRTIQRHAQFFHAIAHTALKLSIARKKARSKF